MTAPASRPPTGATAAIPLHERSIEIVVEPPGPLAREQIARQRPYVSPSLIYCYPLFVQSASGCMVEDVDGNVYLDAQAGVATASTGHCHPAVAAAIAAQAQNLIHICGTDFYYPGYGAVCERLNGLAARLTPERPITWQTFLTNSGTEGVEAALKLARSHTRRSAIIAFRGGFHGRSYGALSLTASKTKYRKHFGPFLPGVFHAEWGDAASIEDQLFAHLVAPDDVAAIVVEPVLGEGGYRLPPVDFLPALRRICDAHHIVLVFDEVQSGMGRTGTMFAAEHFGVVPDVIVLAKGIASGMPLGALIARDEVMQWHSGGHGSTFGGNPVSVAAGLATLRLLEEKLIANAERVGRALMTALRDRLGAHAVVGDVRGLGLMIGVEIVRDRFRREPAPELRERILEEAFRRGLLLLGCGRSTIRLAPPLIVDEEDATTAARILEEAVIASA